MGRCVVHTRGNWVPWAFSRSTMYICDMSLPVILSPSHYLIQQQGKRLLISSLVICSIKGLMKAIAVANISYKWGAGSS
jgi:hypothetical protein